MKQKIKNAYRAQKRRGALSLSSALPKASQDSEDDNSGTGSGDDGAKEGIESASPQSGSPPPDSLSLQLSERQEQSNLPSTSRVNTSTPRTTATSSHAVYPARMKHKPSRLTPSAAPPQDDKAARARELLREAYSPASLHTFKSDSLRKRGSQTAQRGRGRGMGREGISGVRGRGQPDMRKRIGALLAQMEAHK
jgi:hypothetical protein